MDLWNDEAPRVNLHILNAGLCPLPLLLLLGLGHLLLLGGLLLRGGKERDALLLLARRRRCLAPDLWESLQIFQGLDFGYPFFLPLSVEEVEGAVGRSEGWGFNARLPPKSCPHPLEGHAKGLRFWITVPVVPPRDLVVGEACLGCLVAKVATHQGGGSGCATPSHAWR